MFEHKIFEKINYTESLMNKGEYENCKFINCIFFRSDLSSIIFRDCEFNDCDFSLAKMKNTVLNDVKFLNCKLLGLQFNECNNFLLSVYFENCQLKLSLFYKLKLKKTKFKNCNLQEVDFSEADLTSSIFENCDLQRATFNNTNIEKVDFRSSYNYSIDPEINRMKKARFSRMGIAGLLDKYNIEIE